MSSEVHNNRDTAETELKESGIDWERYIGLENILDSYDTIVEVYDGSQLLNPDSETLDRHDAEYHSLANEVVQPGWDYNSRSEGIEFIRERLEGRSLVLAFGFDGEDLPNYSEVGGELDPRGNWWDQPERLPADVMVDDQTYSGALRPPKASEISPHVFRNDDGELRDVFHIT